ncbi:sensor histidine kinase [Paenibacillus sanguinis]|uniref:sensor histidine kinase n=1 Tax=Paenibacillus sanguinis TaxID=225906 RepID=UPI000380476F|nr:sensor histidine kinase [Paenibacillus sanguinis]
MKKYIPFTYKMLIPYLLLVLLTDVILGYVSYSMLVESRTEMAETNIRTGMEQARNNIRYQMDEIQRMSDTLFGDLAFQRALQTRGEPYDIYLVMMDVIVPQVTAPLKLFGNDIRLMLYTLNDDLNMVAGDHLEEPISESDYYIFPFKEMESAAWYRELKESGQDNTWVQVDTDGQLGNISHMRRLISYNGNITLIGYLRITASLDDLFGDFSTFPVEEGITVRLLHKAADRKLLYQRGSAAAGAGVNGYLSLYEPIPGSDFIIEALVPEAYLKKDAGRMQQVVLTVCGISFIGMTVIGLVVARLSGRKMNRIVRLVRSFQDGNFQKRIRFSGNDEFVHIADAFNVMADDIQKLINSVYVQGIEKKQAELKALQAQINPHFLYNTLSTISSLANLGETSKVTEMVQGLSRFYRLTLNQGKVVTTLQNELMQVETYLDIQRVKYAGAFAVHIDVEPEILPIPVMKLILQPFVENTFKHAWFGETITILIVGKRRGHQIELKVIDNGIGMKPEVAARLIEGPTHSGGYGVKNVHERIRLRYGEPYGIRIASIFGGGTTVQIKIPFTPASAPDP